MANSVVRVGEQLDCLFQRERLAQHWQYTSGHLTD